MWICERNYDRVTAGSKGARSAQIMHNRYIRKLHDGQRLSNGSQYILSSEDVGICRAQKPQRLQQLCVVKRLNLGGQIPITVWVFYSISLTSQVVGIANMANVTLLLQKLICQVAKFVKSFHHCFRQATSDLCNGTVMVSISFAFGGTTRLQLGAALGSMMTSAESAERFKRA